MTCKHVLRPTQRRPDNLTGNFPDNPAAKLAGNFAVVRPLIGAHTAEITMWPVHVTGAGLAHCTLETQCILPHTFPEQGSLGCSRVATTTPEPSESRCL